ncbi:hypothetical protein Pelo_7186 [Pelomyxa schiedti]|nr:hypothetical protein Pelo_7186 [Pelomyxa schiedti]
MFRKCTCICSDETKEESHSAWPWKKFTTLGQKWQKKLNEEDTEEIFNASASSDPRQRDLAMHHMLLRSDLQDSLRQQYQRQQFSGTTTSQSTTTMTSVRNARQGGCDSGGRRRDPQQEEKQQEDDTSNGNPDPELDLQDQDEDDSGLNQGTDAQEPPMKKARAQMLDALKSCWRLLQLSVRLQEEIYLPPSTPGVAMSMESGVATISNQLPFNQNSASTPVANTSAPVTNTFAPVVNTSTPGIPVKYFHAYNTWKS